jgi:hypothetical protein
MGAEGIPLGAFRLRVHGAWADTKTIAPCLHAALITDGGNVSFGEQKLSLSQACAWRVERCANVLQTRHHLHAACTNH